jgi:hypothetical protein
MDHVGNYFSKVTQKLFQKITEKENFINVVKDKTGIELKTNDFVIKNHIVRLNIFGPKRTKILSASDSILEDMNKNNIIVRLE